MNFFMLSIFVMLSDNPMSVFPNNRPRQRETPPDNVRGVGFSMTFQGIRNQIPRDANRIALRSFLAERDLTPDANVDSSCHLLDRDGRQLEFDGHWTDLHIDPLDTEGVLSGGIWHATISVEEVDFIFEMCVAADWLVVNHQGGDDSPTFLVPNSNHDESDLAGLLEEPNHMFVGDSTEMREALLGGYRRFIEWRDQVLRA